MRTVSTILLTVFLSSNNLFSQSTLLDYLKKAPTVSTFDEYSFTAENYSEYKFKIGSKVMQLDFLDTIPIEVFNNFVRNNLYPRRPHKLYPFMISVKGERKVDSIKLSSVGLLETSEVLNKQKCYPKVIVIGKRIVSKGVIEFLLVTNTADGVYSELYVFDMKTSRILSYVPLFQGEKIDRTNCHPLGKNRVAAYQTIEINKGLITQSINDGFNDIWTRRIRLNENGYYELIWFNNPLKESKVYSAKINDPDGDTNVRRLPSSKSKIIYKISADEMFQVEELPDAKDWYKIFNYKDFYDGWIHKSRVKVLNKL